jgi:hypothetical protein
MIFIRIIKGIFLVLSMILTFLCFVGDDIKKMCFFWNSKYLVSNRFGT